MKMKNLLIGGMSLALVACISVGATLAYLTTTSQTVTNTFTVGEGYDTNALTLDETKKVDETNPIKIDLKNRTSPTLDETQVYAPINIGDIVAKDPTFHVKANSADSYLFVKVTGLDNLVGLKDRETGFVVSDQDPSSINASDPGVTKLCDGWKKYATLSGGKSDDSDKTLDGYYVRIVTTKTMQQDFPLFKSVVLPTSVTQMPTGVKNVNIVVNGAMVQKDNLSEDKAWDQVKTGFDVA